jgi:single-strand DNA-binding protein
MSINRVLISGNLTRDAEMRVTQSGKAVVSFGVAVNDRRKNPKTGEWEDVPNFVDCVVFGKYGEAMQKRLLKGNHVFVDGMLRYSSWESQDGSKRSKLEVIVNTVEANQRQQSQQTQQAPKQQGYPYQAPKFEEVPGTVYDEDIPFD